MKYFRNSNLRFTDISCIDGAETYMMVVESFFTSVKILLVKLWALKKSSRWLRNNFDWTFHKNSKMAPIGLLKPPSQNDKYFLDNFQRISKHVNMGQSIQEWAKYIFLKTVFHKFYLVYSWILCPIKYYVDGRCQAHCWNENLEVFMGTFDLECMIKKPMFPICPS